MSHTPDVFSQSRPATPLVSLQSRSVWLEVKETILVVVGGHNPISRCVLKTKSWFAWGREIPPQNCHINSCWQFLGPALQMLDLPAPKIARSNPLKYSFLGFHLSTHPSIIYLSSIYPVHSVSPENSKTLPFNFSNYLHVWISYFHDTFMPLVFLYSPQNLIEVK